MSHADEPANHRLPPLSWHVAADGARFYRDGVPVLTIPPDRYARLLADIATQMAHRIPTIGG
jgi:hypothetical protein